MDEFSFDSNASGSFDGGLNFDSPVPPSYSADNTFDSFGSGGGQGTGDFGSFGEPVAAQQGSMGSFGDGNTPQQPQTLDFDAFGTPEPQNTGSFGSADAQPLGSFDGSPIQPNNEAQSPMGSFDAPSSSGLDFGETASPQVEQNSVEPVAETQAPSSPASSSIGGSFRMSMPVESSDALREYEEEHNKFLEEKAQEEREKHQKVIENAKQELEKFYNERKQKLNASREENRSNQGSTSSEAPADDKEAWKRLESLVNWDTSHSESANTERMRGILVDMKHAA